MPAIARETMPSEQQRKNRQAKRKARRQARQNPRKQPQKEVRYPSEKNAMKRVAIQRTYPGMSRVALSIALPVDHPGVRLPTVDMPRTSIITVRDTFTVTTPTNTVAYNGFGLGTILYAHYGQPARLGMLATICSVTSLYSCQFNNNRTSGTYSKWIWSNGTISTPGTYPIEESWPFVGARWFSGETFHGPTVPYGASTSGNYVFMNLNDTLNLSMYQAGTWDGSYTISAHAYETPGAAPLEVASIKVLVTAGQGYYNFTAPKTGYYSVRLGTVELTSGTIITGAGMNAHLSVVADAANLKWANKVMGDVDPGNSGDVNIVECCRTNASSFLMTNTSAGLYKQGTVIAARLREHVPFVVSMSSLSKAAEKYNKEAEHGVYSFMEFSAESENFKNNGEDGNLSYDLDYPGFYHFVAISNPAYATAPNVYSVSLDTTLEFKTDVARYARDVAKSDVMELVRARQLINSNPNWFYENPMHMSDIYGFVKRGGAALARGAKAVAPYALTAASAIDPQRAQLYQLMKRLML